MIRSLSMETENDSGMDSFLDIITNVIGVLILIAATIALQVANVSIKITAPMVCDPPSGMSASCFHCGSNRIVSSNYYQRIWRELIEPKLATKFPDGYYYRDAVNALNQESFGTPDVDSKFIEGNRGFMLETVVLPNHKKGGLEDLRSGKSEYEASLEKLDPNSEFLYFYVTKSSFPVFCEARKIARAKGFRTGFEVMSAESLYTGIYTYGEFGSAQQIND